jgi:hypothetical protein
VARADLLCRGSATLFKTTGRGVRKSWHEPGALRVVAHFLRIT